MKKVLSLVLVMLMTLTVMLVVVPPIEVSAATTYEFLFPVNNGGVNIAFLYGYTSAYGSEFHRGIDIYSNGDDTIYAAFSGTVTWVANSCPCVTNPNNCPHTNTWGNCVQIKSNDGKFYGIYGHLKQNSILVSNGQKVEKGQPLASMGSSGYSFGKHLHFELRTDPNNRETSINVNPTNASQNKGLVNYSTIGYNQIEPATIAEGEYYLKNGDYRVYMVKDDKGADTIAASSTDYDGNELFGFSVVKDGSYYKITPILTNNDYVLNCYWGKGGIQTLSGNEITLWINDGDRSERWIFEEYGAGYLIHPADRTDLAITREGSKLYVRETTKAQNQIWEFESFCSHIYKKNFNSTQHWNECSKCGDKRTFGSHTYTNNCDTGCNICNYTRTAPHTYSYSCDPSCNDCYSQREVTHTYNSTYSHNSVDHWNICTICGNYGNITEHSYTNSCDTTCNVCDYQRTITHTWDYSYQYNNSKHWRQCTVCKTNEEEQEHFFVNDCDATCNTCGYTRTIEHTYDNSCDPDCNVCGSIRAYSHTYDNACDTECNVCGKTRVREHAYDDEQDATCNSCGAVRELETTTPNDNSEGNTTSNDKKPSKSDKTDKNYDEEDNESDGIGTTAIILIAVSSAVAISAGSVLTTTLIMKKKR